MNLIESYRQAGFNDAEIIPEINRRRVTYHEAGFTRQEIDDYVGVFNPMEDISMLGPEVTEPEENIAEDTEDISIREQLKVKKVFEKLPSPFAEEVRKRAIEMQREKEFGTVSEMPFSMSYAVKNIPRNINDIVNSVSSLIMGTGRFGWNFGKNLIADVNTAFSGKLQEEDVEGEVEKQFKPLTDVVNAVITDWSLMLSGETPTELNKLPTGKVVNMAMETLERQGIGKTLKNFVMEYPVDAFLIGNALYSATGAGIRVSMEGVNTFIPKGTKVSKAIDDVLSTKRSPITYDMPVITDTLESAKSIEFARQYSENPLTKYIFQKQFDSVLEEYPAMAQMLASRKAKKLLGSMRNMYEEATFEERAKMHQDIFKELNALTKEEQAIMVPYLEGRLSLIEEPSEKFKGFETWYRSLVQTVQDDLMQRGKITAGVIEDRMYQPIMKATGLTKEQVVSEFGDFSPVYVHHFFPDRYASKMGIHFADTTGKRFKPSFLKQSKGVSGYSENLKEILPKWTSEYIKYKNTEAFINDFTAKFGIKVNIKDVQEVSGGLKVGEKVYPGYKIVAPDNYLSFYRGKVDFYKEVSKRMENATFDEAVADAITETITKTGGSAGRTAKLIEDRVSEALEHRGFSKGESAQMINRLKSGEASEIETIKTIMVNKGIRKEDVTGLFEGVFKEYIGVSRNKPVYLIPGELSAELESFATPIFGSSKAQDVVRLLVDKPTQVWKDSVLALAPRWIKNNVMGDIIFNTMEGVGPLSYSRGFQKMYQNVIPDQLLKASFANVMKYNPQLGKTAETGIGELVDALYKSKVVEGISKVKDTGYAINTMFEQPFVRALYVKLAREKAVSQLKAKNMAASNENIIQEMGIIKNTPEMVEPLVKTVKETLPVFNLSGNFERKYIRRFVPFYNWYKFMAQYAAKLPAKHPFKTVGARGLGALAENDREQAFIDMFPFMKAEIEESGIPEVFNHLWPVNAENGKVTFFNARGLNPFDTIQDFAELDFINMFSPVVTVPYERITGRSAFGDREFMSGERGVEVTVDGVRYNDFEKVKPPLMDHILSNFPAYELLKQSLVPARQYDTGTVFNPEPIIDEITGEPRYKIDNIEKILNYMGIDRKTVEKIDFRARWDNYKQRKRQALGEAFRKGQGKASQALTSEEIIGIIDEIKQDTKLWNELTSQVEDIAKTKKEETERLKEKMDLEESQ